MNKKNGIIIGILTLSVMMMVGYAIFSETITINGTATAKGDFSITATCTPGITNDQFLSEGNIFGYAPKNDNNYKNDSCSVTGNKVTYSAELSQPGSVRNFTVKITNSGTIDAELNPNSGMTTKYESCIGNYDTGEFTNCKTDGSQAQIELSEGIIVGMEKVDGTIVFATDIEGFTDFLKEVNEETLIVLKPGESMFYVVSSEWDILGDEIESSKKVLFKETLTTEFLFKQPTS